MSTGQTKRKSPGGGKAGGSSSSSSFSKKKSKSFASTSSKTATSTSTPTSSANNAASNSNSNSNSTKRELKHERQSTRKHAEAVLEAKTIWNQLRLKTNSKQDTQELMERLMPLVTGKATEIALQHDASRCVQAALQFGNMQQRRVLVAELTATPGNLAELSKSLYAQFVVLKMIQYCCDAAVAAAAGKKDKDNDHDNDVEWCVTKVTRNLKGHLCKMATHAVASKIVESLFRKLSAKQMAVLKQEFYGPQFSLFATSNDFVKNQQNNNQTTTTANNNTTKKIPDLAANLAMAPEKTAATMEFVAHLIHTCMEKSLYGMDYFQTYLSEYCSVASPVEIRNLASTAGAAHNAIHLLASRAGTRALSFLIAYATAKDRKAMLKSIKGYGRSGLLHKDAYLAIIRLVQLTDDTVVVQKNLLQELVTMPTKNNKDNVIINKDKKHEQQEQTEKQKQQDSPLLEICTSETGSKLFLMLLPNPETGAWRKYFDPYELSVLFENPTLPSSSSSGNDNKGKEEESTSKKSPILKRQELLDNCLRGPLVQLCCQHTEELLRSRPGCAVFKEVYHAFSSPELVRAVVDACVASLNGVKEVDDNAEENANDDDAAPLLLPLLEDRIGHLAIKNLLVLDAATATTKSDDGDHKSSDDTESLSLFATQFLDRLGERLMDIAQSNRGAFVVAALCKVPSVRKSTIAKLDQKRLEELSKQENVPTAGFQALLKEIKSL